MSASTISTLSTPSPSTNPTTTNLDTLYILQKRASTAFLAAETRATALATELSRRSTLLENQDWKLQRLGLKLRENHDANDCLEEEFKLAVELYMELCNECNEAEVALMEAERESRRRREEVKRAEERCIRAVWRRSGVGG